MSTNVINQNSAANVQDSRKEVEMNTQKLTILYQRLSKDDLNSSEIESKSITKVMFLLGSHLSKPTYLK